MHPLLYIYSDVHRFILLYNNRECNIINESRRVARYCFECAERDIFVEANERKKLGAA